MPEDTHTVMDRISLAFARICFFLMLFVSTACNKMDRSLQDVSDAQAPAVVQADAARRVHELEGRVKALEAELRAVNLSASADFGIPGGMNWD